MAVTVMRDTIACPRCGNRRVVTQRQRRRASATQGGILCTTCRGIGETRAFSDSDIAWWLRRFGANPPAGLPVRAFVASGGAPAELVELAHDVYPP
jgi:hypothetical protein